MGTLPLLTSCLRQYIRGRGSLLLQDIPGLPHLWFQFAREQDQIGWDNFVSGMVGLSILPIVRLQLLASQSLHTAEDWIWTVIDGLLTITHRQWLYRNAVAHSSMQDGLTRDDQQHLFQQIVSQYRMGKAGLLEDDFHLLDVDLDTLWSQDGLQKNIGYKRLI